MIFAEGDVVCTSTPLSEGDSEKNEIDVTYYIYNNHNNMTTETAMTTTTAIAVTSPFQLLDDLLVSLLNESTTGEEQREEDQQHFQIMDVVLRAAHVLYPTDDILQDALTILDQAVCNKMMIRKLVSVPSQRQVYVIEQKSYNKPYQQEQQQHQSQPCDGYICFFPDNKNNNNNNDATTPIDYIDDGERMFLYCSCSSFWERNNHTNTIANNTNNNTNSIPTVTRLCQHLLALQLLPLVAPNMMTHEEQQQQPPPPQQLPSLTTTTCHVVPHVEKIPDHDFGKRILPYMYG
jgi:hypothetical protein